MERREKRDCIWWCGMLLLSFCALVVCLLCYGGNATIVWHAGIQSVRKSASPHPKWKTTHMAWHIQYPWAQYACCTTDRISACKVSSCAYRGWSSPVRLSNARQSRGLPAPNGRWANEVWLNENTNIAIYDHEMFGLSARGLKKVAA